MKRVLTVSMLLLVIVFFAQAQMAYKQGDQVAGVYGSGGFPPISVAYETGLTENISVGGLLGYTTSEESYWTWKWTYSYIIIAARGAYHIDLFHKSNIDTYGGLLLGYNIVSSSVEGPGTAWGYSAGGSYLLFGGFIGGRYYFSPKLAAQAELGYGMGYLTIGISYKL